MGLRRREGGDHRGDLVAGAGAVGHDHPVPALQRAARIDPAHPLERERHAHTRVLGRPDEPPVVLTGTAAAIWDAVDGARDDEAVASSVADLYGVPVDEIRHEVLTFLQHLASCRLLPRT